METREIDLSRYPSVMQNERHAEKTSERYSFVSTLQVVDVLRQSEWMPVSARESGSQLHNGFQKHEIRFRNPAFNRELMVGEEVPEVVLQNSHMGTASFHLMAGLFRCICSNQMCVPSGIAGDFRVRHVGYANRFVQAALDGIVKTMPKTLERVEGYKAIPLDLSEQNAFAKAAIELRFDGDRYSVDPHAMLSKRRSGDSGDDLWTVFSRVQENVIRGGITTRNRKGKRRRSRPVRSIDTSTSLNRSLWILADEMARLKAS